MKYKDYYALMGVARTATLAEIKTAHRKLARKYHPDLNKDGGAEARFKEIGEAYQVLKDDEKRAAYDAFGTGYKNGDEIRPQRAAPQQQGFDPEPDQGSGEHDMNEFFESVCGARGHGSSRRSAFDMPGQDHHAQVLIDLKDSYTGAQRALTLQMPTVDSDGRHTYATRTLNVTIPKGILAGQQLRLAGQGGAGEGHAKSGDLYLEVAFAAQSRFHVEGSDVTIDVPIAPWEAALGGAITVPTPDGSVTVTVPAGSASGRRLRLKGRGIPAKKLGNFYVSLNIAVPPATTDTQKTAYKSFKQAFSFDPRAHFKGGLT